MMGAVRVLALIVAALLSAPTTAAAQTPPPDERAAAEAMAGAADRLLAAANDLDDDPGRLADCRALDREPPQRRRSAATAFLDALVLRDLLGKLAPAIQRARGEIADARTADPALLSGRAALRQILRTIAAVPPPEADPCAAYRDFARAGYPRGPARRARAIQRAVESSGTRGRARKIEAAADRMVELGLTVEATNAFRDLAQP